jgi:hypothetical protein
VVAEDSLQLSRRLAQQYRGPAVASRLAHQVHFRQIDELTSASIEHGFEHEHAVHTGRAESLLVRCIERWFTSVRYERGRRHDPRVIWNDSGRQACRDRGSTCDHSK